MVFAVFRIDKKVFKVMLTRWRCVSLYAESLKSYNRDQSKSESVLRTQSRISKKL